MEIGQAIKTIRKSKGFKQKDLSERCEITQTYLSLIEHGKRNPNINLIEKISAILGVPVPVIYFQSLTENDVENSKKDVFRIVSPTINELINNIFLK